MRLLMHKIQQSQNSTITLSFKTIILIVFVFYIFLDSANDAHSAVVYGGKSEIFGSGASITISPPVGTSTGDLLVVMIVTKNDAAVDPIVPPPLWALLDVGVGAGNRGSVGVWWKLAGVGEPDATFTWTSTPPVYGIMMRFSGHDSGNPIDAISAPANGTSNTPLSESVISTVVDTLILRVGGFNGTDLTGLPAGHTPISLANGTGNSVSAGAAYVYQSAIGASGTSNFTLGKQKAFRTLTLAITPAVGGLPPAASSATAEISPNNVTTSSTNVSFSYDIDPTIGSGTGVDQVIISAGTGYSNFAVTDVNIGPVTNLNESASCPVMAVNEFCYDVIGQEITISFSNNRITSDVGDNHINVAFSADVPGIADGTGQDFISSVNDTTSATAAQSTVNGNADNDNLDNNSYRVTVTDTVVSSDLAVTTVVDSSTPDEGSTIAYTITVTNNGPNTISNLSLDDVLPTGLTSISAIPTQGVWTNPTWTIGSLNSGTSATLVYQASVDTGTGGSIITNTITSVTMDQVDNNATLDDNSESITVNNISDLVITNVVDNASPSEGDTVIFTITATNNGPAQVTNLSLADALPVGLSPVSDGVSQGSFTASTWSVGTINSGASATLTLTVSVDIGTSGSTLSTSVSGISVDQTDSNVTADDLSESVLVGPDVVSPAAIVDLALSSRTETSVTINWTATGDSNNVGTASSYDIRYSTSPITTINWPTATQATGEPTPSAVGINDNMTINSLTSNTLYYFAIITNDEVPNSSNLSNVLSVSTLGNAVTSVIGEISPNQVAISSTANSFQYDILPTINSGSGDSGINQVAIVVPAAYNNASVTAVRVNGSAVGYTDNSIGNSLQVDLTSIVTNNVIISVSLVADAPATLGNSDFNATVDDTNTSAVTSQVVNVGNADADATDNNSITVEVAGLAVTSGLAEISPTLVSTGINTSFAVDILPNYIIANNDTGLNRIIVDLPSGFSNLTLNDVLVNSSSVVYTNNSSGTQISADLFAKVTASTNIQLLFTANPSNNTGNFPISVSVDDISTPGVSPQLLTAGNANATAGDSDTLTLTIEANADALSSRVIANPQIVVADGTSSATITVTLRDASQNAKSGRTIQLSSDRNASSTVDVITQPSSVTDVSGMTSGTITSAVPGVSTITTLELGDNVILNDKPQVFFTQGELLKLSMSANKTDVLVGDIITYTIELRNISSQDVTLVNLINQLPANFKYHNDSARLNSSAIAGIVNNGNLEINLGTISALVDTNGNGQADEGEPGYAKVTYQLIIGSGVHPGEYTNSVQAVDVCSSCYVSNQDQAKISVSVDPLFDLGTIIGKVFEDKNLSGYQENGEPGVAGVMVALDSGIYAITDEFGRYHFPAVKPGQRAIKINLQSIQDIADVTTDLVKIVSITPGLLAKANFGIEYKHEVETIGRPAQYGLEVKGSQNNTAIDITGNITSLSLLINGQLAAISSDDVKLLVDSSDDVIVIESGVLKNPINFIPSLQNPQSVSNWSLNIFNNNNVVVKTISGTRQPPEIINWDGYLQNGQFIIATEIYHYQLVLTYHDRTKTTSLRRNFGINQRTAISINLASDAFATGSASLGNDAIQVLKDAAKVLRKYPKEIITVTGHTDNTGTKPINLALSKQRAQTAVDYLVNKGKLPKKRFKVRGVGSDQPIADNISEEGRTLNRRIEIQGTAIDVDQAKLHKQYKTRPSVRINQTYIAIDPYGRFLHKLQDADTTSLNVEMSNAYGRSVNTKIDLPTFDIAKPTDAVILAFGATEDNYAVYEPNENSPIKKSLDDKKILTLRYKLVANTAAENTVLLDGNPLTVANSGEVSSIINLHLDENIFSVIVSNPQGVSRLIQLKIVVSKTDSDGKAFIAVEQIPNMLVKLPPKGANLKSGDFVVEGSTDFGNSITINDTSVDVSEDGHFLHTLNLQPGKTKVIIAVKDPEGYLGLIERDIEITENKLFLLAFADGRYGKLKADGNLRNAGQTKSSEYYQEGRITYYLRGTIAGKYLIRSSFDSDRDDFDQLFSGLNDSENDHLLRNIDPERIYPVYGDNSTLVYDTESRGKFFLAIESDELDAIVGNYKLTLNDTELANYQRTFYGARVKYQTIARTKYGQSDLKLVVFGAEVPQIHIRDEIRTMGGSLYYLSHRKIIEGSEQVTLVVRDKNTELTLSRTPQKQNIDYSIKYEQGRILFTRPISSVVADNGLVNQSLLAGHPVYIQIDYETQVDSLEKNASGGYVRKQLGDHFSIGGTYVNDELSTAKYELQGIDIEYRVGKHTRIVTEFAKSKNSDSNTFFSEDGGITFNETTVSGIDGGKAWKVGITTHITDLIDSDLDLSISAYIKEKEAAFLSNNISQGAGQNSNLSAGTRKSGIHIKYKLSQSDELALNYDAENLLKDGGSSAPTTGISDSNLLDVQWQHNAEKWTLSTEYQSQQSTNVTDGKVEINTGAAKLSWRNTDKLTTSIQHQETIEGPDNNQTTLGIDYWITESLNINTSATKGTKGQSGQATAIMSFEQGQVYLTERIVEDDMGHANSTIVGASTRVGKSSKVYTEYQRENLPQGQRNVSLTGLQNNWKFSKSWSIRLFNEYSVIDASNNDTGNSESGRYATAVGVSYGFPSGSNFNTRNEYRKMWGATDTKQYLSSNLLELKLNPDYSLLSKYRYSKTFDTNTDLTIAQFDERSIGLAYRPTQNDKFNFLFRYTIQKDQRPSSNDSVINNLTRADVLSAEWSWDLNRYIEWVDKEAIRVKKETSADYADLESKTLLSIHRLNFHLTKRIDLAVEYRELRQNQANDMLKGWLTELNWKIYKHVRLGAGYNFTDFSDNEFSDNDYSVRGSFIRIQALY